MYYTYMLKCEDGSIYTGITTDPQRRFREHSDGGKKAAKYTRTRKAVNIIALWQSENRSAASKLEYGIKTLTKSQKETMAASGQLTALKNRLDTDSYTFVPLCSENFSAVLECDNEIQQTSAGRPEEMKNR